MKAIILARVSTEEQLKEGQSIPAQLARAREYCQRKTLEIKSEYQFDESSTKDQREKFERVLEEIKNSKEKVALVVETIDRLQRSFRESVILDDLRKQDKVEIHFLRENLVISINSNSSDLLRWDMGVMFARSYVLQLSDNVKRSIEQKLRNGEWPGMAPYGYKNITREDGKKDIVPDEYESKIVQKMYEWYATGAFSMLLVRQKLKKDYNFDFSKGYIDAILKNPFYYGEMRFKGKLYPHRYEPLISKELFDKVQQIKAGYNKRHFKYAGLPYIYRGLIRCADCGCMITPEKAKDKYVYYHCTQYKGKHNAQWLREEEITEQFAQLFKRIQIPKEVLNDITESLKSIHKGKSELREQQFEALTKEKDRYAKRIENMYLDKLDGRITTDEYDRLYKMFREKIEEIDNRLANLQKAEDNYYLNVNYLLQLANKAYNLFVSSEIEEKRQLLKLLLQNPTLDGKKVRFTLLKPFDTILNYADSQLWLPG
jgi:site-specific DNA recombinase